MTREEYAILEEKISRVMEPEAWKEFDAGKGVCTNESGWKIMESLRNAARVILLLEKEGLITYGT